MKIKDIKSGDGKIEIEADVMDVSEIREVNKYGKPLKVATATIKDDSGQIQLSLWNENTESIRKGDKIKLSNGFAKEFQGNLQVTIGKFGKLQVVKGKTDDVVRTNIAPGEKKEEVPTESLEDEEWQFFFPNIENNLIKKPTILQSSKSIN